VADKIEELRLNVEAVEQKCEVINRREGLLNAHITKFTSVASLQQDLRPFVTLWDVAYNFNNTHQDWLDSPFFELHAEQIEADVNEWWKQLSRVSKSPVCNYQEPMRLLTFLMNKLDKFKTYLPMIAALRTKGLEKRHWSLLSRQLDHDIDPQALTLAELLKQGFHEGESVEVIKGVSEIAIKEYAIKTTLEALDMELKHIEFQPVRYKETDTWVLKGLDDLSTAFEESSIKVLALKNNSYAKHFMDRILRVEKEVR